MNKKEWLDHIYYGVGKQQYDFLVCGLFKDNEGNTRSTKWKKYSEVCFGLDPHEDYMIKWVNQRQILPTEIVLDIEEKGNLNDIIEKLKSFNIGNFIIYDTGSRGYHVHIFSKFPVLKPIKEFLISKFGADMVKSGKKTMIALENCPHWKTGVNKTMVKKYEEGFE